MRLESSPQTSRRKFFRTAALAALTFPSGFSCAQEDTAIAPIEKESLSGLPHWTGPVPHQGFIAQNIPDRIRQALEGIHREILNGMQRYDFPGAVFAFSKDGVLLMSMGYGVCDQELKKPTSPDTMMRVASVEKPIIKTGMELLIDRNEYLQCPDGKRIYVTPDMLIFKAMREAWGLTPPPDIDPDPRIEMLTVRMLMDHSSWITESDCGMALVDSLGIDLQLKSPDYWDDLRWIYGQPLRKPVSTIPPYEFCYSNTGYSVLRYFIHHQLLMTQQRGWIDFLREDLASGSRLTLPAEIRDDSFSVHREIVQTRSDPSSRDPRETIYWSDASGPSMVPGQQRSLVAWPDGGFNYDCLIMPAFSARALLAILERWIIGSDISFVGDSLTIGQSTVISRWMDGGAGVANGGMPGTGAILVQRRASRVNYAAIFNRDGSHAPEWKISEIIDKKYLEPLGL